jgi:hypothetical protein
MEFTVFVLAKEPWIGIWLATQIWFRTDCVNIISRQCGRGSTKCREVLTAILLVLRVLTLCSTKLRAASVVQGGDDELRSDIEGFFAALNLSGMLLQSACDYFSPTYLAQICTSHTLACTRSFSLSNNTTLPLPTTQRCPTRLSSNAYFIPVPWV